MTVKNFVERIFKRSKFDERLKFRGAMQKRHDFILHTNPNELTYIISQREESMYMGGWDEIYSTPDPLKAIERYEALTDKVRKEKASKRLMTAKKELIKAEAVAKNEGILD